MDGRRVLLTASTIVKTKDILEDCHNKDYSTIFLFRRRTRIASGIADL